MPQLRDELGSSRQLYDNHVRRVNVVDFMASIQYVVDHD